MTNNSSADFGPRSAQPTLHPYVNEISKELIHNERSQLIRLPQILNGPVHILVPEQIQTNLNNFQQVFSKYKLESKVFLAHKATQSESLIRELAFLGGNIDIASEEELVSAVSCAFPTTRIQATGPKTKRFLYLCLIQGITINVDSTAELQMILKLQKQLNIAKTKILLRTSNFHRKSLRESRFGISLAEIPQTIEYLSKFHEQIELVGFSFHLDSNSVEERVDALEKLLPLFDLAINAGFEPNIIDIGGGFPVRYLESPDELNYFTQCLKDALSGKKSQVSWNNYSFGMNESGQINSSVYSSTESGAEFLDKILSFPSKLHSQKKIADVIKYYQIELWIQPGRALLDQCGFTLAAINHTRQAMDTTSMAVINMKRSDLSFLDYEYLADPIILYKPRLHLKDGTSNKILLPVYLAGMLCLEGDMILKRKIYTGLPLEEGDVLLFTNTAAYSMDFNKTESIMRPTARKLAVFRNGDSWQFLPDHDYHPIIYKP